MRGWMMPCSRMLCASSARLSASKAVRGCCGVGGVGEGGSSCRLDLRRQEGLNDLSGEGGVGPGGRRRRGVEADRQAVARRLAEADAARDDRCEGAGEVAAPLGG